MVLDGILIQSKSFLNTMLASFNDFRLQGLLSDITIKVDFHGETEEFGAHRLMLAASSGYFKSLILSETWEQDTLLTNIQAPDFAVFLEFVYTGKVEISRRKVVPIQAMAMFLDCPELVMLCEKIRAEKVPRKRKKLSKVPTSTPPPTTSTTTTTTTTIPNTTSTTAPEEKEQSNNPRRSKRKIESKNQESDDSDYTPTKEKTTKIAHGKTLKLRIPRKVAPELEKNEENEVNSEAEMNNDNNETKKSEDSGEEWTPEDDVENYDENYDENDDDYDAIFPEPKEQEPSGDDSFGEEVSKWTSKAQFECTDCQRTFHYEKSFLKHRSTYHGMAAEMVHRCEICQQTFANRSNMKTHERHVHSSERLFSCIICSKTFKRKKDVVRHQRQVHERDNQKYVCSVCGKSLSCKAGLQLHERIHNGTKPYQCSLCESKFTQKTALNMHYRTHTGERPFACTMCDSRFTQKHMLTNHIRSHTGEKPYMCELCGKSFSSREYLRHHLNIHTGAKPFKCEHCQRGFSQRNSLNQHLKIHTGDRPYSCTSCEKQFTQLNALQRHQRIHTGEKPFMCNMCNRTFTDKSTLRRHTTTHSSDAPWTSFLVVLEGNIEDKRLPSEQKNIAADNKSKKSPERRTEDEDEGVKLQTQPETTESSTEASTEATTEATTVAIPPDWASHGAIALVSHAALGGLTVIQTEIPAGTKLQEMVTSDSTGAHLLTLADSAVTAPFSLASTMGQSISATDIPTVSIANGALTIVSESQSVCTPSVLEVAASQTILASDTDGKANDEDILVPNAEIETVVETEASVEMEAVKEDDEDEEGKKP